MTMRTMTALGALSILTAIAGRPASGQGIDLESLPRLEPGRTRAENALWIENPLSARFNSSRRVTVADLKGPGLITMIHFAMPHAMKLDRDLALRMYWDGEETPSVDCPFVDFFCDPAGSREWVTNALVNKRRGWNGYFPMPFRASARIELVYEGTVEPGEELWRIMPCYSYVCWRALEKVPADEGYFHASWRQEGLLLGKRDYTALEAKGNGKLIGWNVTLRLPGRDDYPVDMNEKFFIDGEESASIEFQGIEDSFGFSWGFPPTESIFPLTGWFPFQKGAAAYRFFLGDAVRFEKSLRVAIGFGKDEDPMFREQFSKEGNELQLSSTVYWYQTEPHAPLPALPRVAERAPAPELAFWPHGEKLPAAEELRARGVKLEVLCGRPGKEVVFAEQGFGAEVKKGFRYTGFSLPVYHCLADSGEVEVELTVPPGSKGKVRIFAIDPDSFQGGRKESLAVGGKEAGTLEAFQAGRWTEVPVDAAATASGKVSVRAKNARTGANAVISIIEWMVP